MSQPTLEERVTALEQTVARLLGRRPSEPGPNDWRKTIGMFANDPVMKEIQEEGRKIREAEREQARREAEEDQP